MSDKKTFNNVFLKTSKECSYVALFLALTIGIQFALSFIPGVELVTLLFICYSFVFGLRRSIVCATCFSLLRTIIFGFFPNVVILYLIYYNLLVTIFSLLGKALSPSKHLLIIVAVAVVCTAFFTLLDCIITPLFFSYSKRATTAYFYASLSFAVPQIICSAISITILFIPLTKTLAIAKKGLI